MRVRESRTAGLLLVFINLVTGATTVNAEVVRIRRATTINTEQHPHERIVPINDTTSAQVHDALLHNARQINDDLLSLLEDENDIPERGDDESGFDQQVDQSQLITINHGSPKDSEDTQHASSIVEYKPREIDTKGRRKIVDAFNRNPDSAIDNINPAPAEDARIYYEVPRTIRPKKTTELPPYFPTTSEIPNPSEFEPKAIISDGGHNYPVSKPKPQRSRPSGIRSPVNQQAIIPSMDLTNSEDTAPYSSRSAQSADPSFKKRRHYTGATATTAPSTDVPSAAKSSRRRKTRKRISTEESSSPETNVSNNYNNNPRGANRSRGSTNYASRLKSSRSGSLTRDDVVSTTLSPSGSSVGNQESNFRKSTDESVSNSVTRGSNNYPNAARREEGSPNAYLKTVDPIGSILAHSNRKLHDRRNNRGSATFQINVNSDPPPTGERSEPVHTEYFHSPTVKSNPPYGDEYVPREKNYSQGENDDSRRENLGDDSIFSARFSLNESNARERANINAPGVTVRSIDRALSPGKAEEINLHSDNYPYYPPVLASSAPEQKIRSSGGGKLPKRRRKKVSGEGDERGDRRISDGVAGSRNAGADDAEGLNENRKYEIYETPEEEDAGRYSDARNVEYARSEGNDEESSGTDSSLNNYEDSGKRYAEMYADGKEEDTRGDGSNDNESHQSLADGAATEKEQGGEKKFEKVEGEEEEEERHEADGEKDEKGYKSWHEDEKANKGHHDKEQHSNYFEEKDGKEKEDNDESGYQEEYHEGEKGEKQAEFSEKGEHQKGYNTKGEHFVHKKDEFEKRTEFYDEFHEEDDAEKDEEFYQEHESSKGDNYKVGHHDEEDDEEKYSKESKQEKGSNYDEHKGHKIDQGDDSHYENEETYGKKEDHHDGKKWSYKKGDD